jgi:DNA-binding transcriptional ArsR family regulator
MLRNEYFTIQLIAHFTFLYKRIESSNSLLFFMGASSKETILRWGEYGNITILSIAQAIGVEAKFDIIQKLRGEQKTVTQLAKELFISRSNVDRYMHQLYQERVVDISKKIGAEVYYSLNTSYFLIANKLMDEFFEDSITLPKP